MVESHKVRVSTFNNLGFPPGEDLKGRPPDDERPLNQQYSLIIGNKDKLEAMHREIQEGKNRRKREKAAAAKAKKLQEQSVDKVEVLTAQSKKDRDKAEALKLKHRAASKAQREKLKAAEAAKKEAEAAKKEAEKQNKQLENQVAALQAQLTKLQYPKKGTRGSRPSFFRGTFSFFLCLQPKSRECRQIRLANGASCQQKREFKSAKSLPKTTGAAKRRCRPLRSAVAPEGRHKGLDEMRVLGPKRRVHQYGCVSSM